MSIYVTDDINLDQLVTNGICQNYPLDLTIGSQMVILNGELKSNTIPIYFFT